MGMTAIVIVIGRAGDIVRPGLESSSLRHRVKLELWPTSESLLGKARSGDDCYSCNCLERGR